MSSAYIINLKKSLESAMSLIYITNMSGPKIDPWGTPVVIANSSDLKFPPSTYCLRLYLGSSFRNQVQHHLHHSNLIYVTVCCD